MCAYTTIHLIIRQSSDTCWSCNIHFAQMPQCISSISHNAPYRNWNLYTCTFLLQNGVLWDSGLMYCGIWEKNLFDAIVFMFTIYAQPLLGASFLFMAVLNLSQREVGFNLYRLCLPSLALDEKWPRSQLSYMFQMLASMYVYMAASKIGLWSRYHMQ